MNQLLACLRNLVAISLVSLLAACAAPVAKIDITQATLAEVKTIVVVRPPEPKSFFVRYGPPLGGSQLDLVIWPVLLVMIDDVRSKSDRLSTALGTRRTSIMDDLANKLAAELNQMGFIATVDTRSFEESSGKFKFAFDDIHPLHADAVLVISQNSVGFMAGSPYSSYKPMVLAVATLLGKDRSQILYRGFHNAGFERSQAGWRTTPAKVSFPNFDALTANIETTAMSLSEAATDVAMAIATDLKP